MKILVVEDEELMLKALEFRLKKDGYTIVRAMDGRDALAKIGLEDFDLIITDIMLPFNNGLEIVNQVKNKLGKKTPVIVLSAVGLENVVLEAFDLGADDYITKPFSPTELSIRVKKLLKVSDNAL
ncbi:MAG: response regulator transcription factor [Bacteroidota bacterium]